MNTYRARSNLPSNLPSNLLDHQDNSDSELS